MKKRKEDFINFPILFAAGFFLGLFIKFLPLFPRFPIGGILKRAFNFQKEALIIVGFQQQLHGLGSESLSTASFGYRKIIQQNQVTTIDGSSKAPESAFHHQAPHIRPAFPVHFPDLSEGLPLHRRKGFPVNPVQPKPVQDSPGFFQRYFHDGNLTIFV